MNFTIAARESPSRHRASVGRTLRVLLIEPRPMSSPMLRRWLDRRGHMLDVANDVASGFRQAVAGQPDVVLIDLGLMEKGGLALADRLRSDPTTCTVPLVAMEEATVPARDEGTTMFARHVLKPIDVDELGGVLLEVAAR